jgi:uncharacterized protein
MKINTHTVKEVGQLSLTEEISPQKIDSNPPSGVVYPRAFKCDVDATLADNEILLQGRLAGQAMLTCSRCLEEYPQNIQVEFETVAKPEDGDVDLSGEISQAVVLSLPMKPLCREQCRGLCPHCGQNLNEANCRCKPEPIHPGLAPLKNLI